MQRVLERKKTGRRKIALEKKTDVMTPFSMKSLDKPSSFKAFCQSLQMREDYRKCLEKDRQLTKHLEEKATKTMHSNQTWDTADIDDKF